MSDQKPSIDLSAFTEYLVVGERDSPDESRIFVADRKQSDDARRRDDRTAVLITVHTTPRGDEANALTQYAADTGTLIGLTHRRLVPVLDGKWIGENLFAVVTQRVADPTLAQNIVTGSDFHSTRIAAILREVNGLLEWAREHKIVHRRVTPEQIYLEPKTDRVRVTFAIAPISRLKQPGPHDDARTIARLAVAMLGGDPDIQTCDQDALQSLRPGLPQLFCQATSKLLDPQDTATPDDVAAFLGLISMADPLVEGESERDRIRAEILEEQRQEREKLASERAAFDATVASERAAFDAQVAAERAAFEKLKADERARVEHERAELEKAVTNERAELQAALAAERAALLAKRTELEKTVADQRAELERAAAKDRAEVERLRVELRTAGDQEIERKRLTALEDITGDEESVLDHEDLAVPMFGLPVLPPIEPVTFNDDTPVLSDDAILFPAGPPPQGLEETEEPDRDTTGGFWASSRNRLIAAILAGLAVAGAVSAAVIAHNNSASARPAPRAAVVRAPVRVDSATAATAAAAAVTPAAPMTFTVDSSTARTWLDSLKHAHPMDVSWAIDMARVQVARAERARAAALRDSARAAPSGSPPGIVAGSTAGSTSGGAAGGTRASRSAGRPGADGVLSQPAGVRASRRDSSTVRRDSTARPDSSVPPPN